MSAETRTQTAIGSISIEACPTINKVPAAFKGQIVSSIYYDEWNDGNTLHFIKIKFVC